MKSFVVALTALMAGMVTADLPYTASFCGPPPNPATGQPIGVADNADVWTIISWVEKGPSCSTTGNGACMRVGIKNTSAIFLCSHVENPNSVTVDNWAVASLAATVALCDNPNATGNDVSGYVDVPDAGGYRVYVAYGNSHYPPWNGPNEQ